MKYITILFALLTSLLFAEEDRLILLGVSYGKNVVAICEADGTVIWKHDTGGPEHGHTGHHDIQLLDDGNILYHDSWVWLQEINLKGEQVWRYDSHLENGNRGERVSVHAFDRLANGETVIVESFVGRIIHVDKDKNITKTIPLGEGGRKATRLMNMTKEGTYIVAAEHPGVVTEYNDQGEILWEHNVGTRVYGALRLKNGNTLICTGSGNSVIEVSPSNEVVWEIGRNELPNITLAWMTDLQELPNGNLVIGNCHASEKDPQIIEVNREKEVVWSFNEWDLVGDGLASWEILSPKQTKLIREKLATLK